MFKVSLVGLAGLLLCALAPADATPLEPHDGGEVDSIREGVQVWSDRPTYRAADWPASLAGQTFIRSSINASVAEAKKSGYVLVVTPIRGGISEAETLRAAGFQRVDIEPFVPFTGGIDDGRDKCFVFQKAVQAGDTVSYGRYGITLWRADSLPVAEEEFVESPITIPTIDLSDQTERHSVVAPGTTQIYQGHVDTVLMPDGKTIFVAWTIGHARHIGPLARSDDEGVTWSSLIKVPHDWWHVSNTPTIHHLVDPDGVARLFVFGGGLDWERQGKPPYPMMQAVSEDGGRTWSSMAENGIEGEVPPKSIKSFENGKKLLMWSDLPGYVVQSASYDGGLTWEKEEKIVDVPGRWAQPAVVRSPDGDQLLMLMREQTRQQNSLYSVSNDEGKTWTEAKELPPALTGDRHVMRYAPDGRLVVVMRDQGGQAIEGWQSPTQGHFIAWVGTYEDIVQGREGQYRVKLLHSYAGGDCGYAGLEVLPDGTFVATTYIKYTPDPSVKHSVISTRFTLAELDEKLAP